MPVLSPVNESPEKSTLPNKTLLNTNRPPLIHTDGSTAGNGDDKGSQSMKRGEPEASSMPQAKTPKHSNKNGPPGPLANSKYSSLVIRSRQQCYILT